MKKIISLLPVLLMLTLFPLFSQETAEDDTRISDVPEPMESETPVYDPDALFVIVEFNYDINGRTNPTALAYRGEFKEGEELHGMEELEEYVAEKTQVLINQRVLKDNPAITYSIGEQQEDGAYPVTLFIAIEDSWNAVALPYPKYSSSNGLDLIIKARDYNFMGTMNPLRLDLGYKYDEKGRTSFSLGLDSNTYFRAMGYNWNLKFANNFSYRPDAEEPYYYQNITGLSMELPFRTTTFTFGFEESFNLNEQNDDHYAEQYGEFQKGPYMSSKLYTTWKIPTGFFVSRYGELTYTPGISTRINHELPKSPLQEIRKGPFLDVYHTLGFEKVNWHGNYREGLDVSIDNSYSYDFYRLSNDKDPLSVFYSVNGTGHFIFSKFFGISSRIQYRQWFYKDPDYYHLAGDVFRGIADRAITADYMLSMNLDFPLRVLVFAPSRWFNYKKFELFDFEMHLSPVFDAAIYHDPLTETSFDFKNTLITGGMELIIFPDFFRSLFLRVCFAWNLREMLESKPYKIPGGQNREFSLIIGHFY